MRLSSPEWRLPAITNGGVLVVFLAWHLASTFYLEGVLPGPVAVAARLAERLQERAFLFDIAMSALRVAIAISAAMLIGGFLAIVPYWVPALQSTIHKTVKPLLGSFPAIAWALLASIWFGVSNFSVIFVQTAILIPFCLINVGEGVRVIDREMIEMAKSFEGRKGRSLFLVMLPLLSPYFVSALRTAYGIAWKIALVSELFGAQSGLGFAMLRAETLADTESVLAICLLIVIIGILGDRLLIEPLNRRTQGISSLQ